MAQRVSLVGPRFARFRASVSSADLNSADTCCSSRMVGWKDFSVWPRLRAIWQGGGRGEARQRQRRGASESAGGTQRASASPLGPNTSSETTAMTKASGAPTPRKEARTALRGGREGKR